MENSTPTANDLAFPNVRHVAAPGICVDLLTAYWQQHPELSPVLPGTPQVQIAMWRDGTMAGVPARADATMLAKLYTSARVVATLKE